MVYRKHKEIAMHSSLNGIDIRGSVSLHEFVSANQTSLTD